MQDTDMTTLQKPHDLLSAVPFLIGYHPQNSLVVVALRGEKIGLAMRIDYPENLDPLPFQTITSHLIYEKADGALLVLYLPEDEKDGELLAKLVASIFKKAEINVPEILIVKEERWRSLLCQDDKCCSLEGNPLPNLDHSRVAAEQVYSGKILPFKTREELENSLNYLNEEPFAKEVASKLLHLNEEELNISIKEFRIKAAENCAHLIDKYLENRSISDSELIAKFVLDLNDLTIRDYAFGITTQESLEVLWEFWLWTLRITPIGFRAPIATIFAVLSYERGEAAIANQSLEIAFIDNPQYSMANLLKRTFDAGWPASAFESMRRELHPKICETIFSPLEQELEEEKSS